MTLERARAASHSAPVDMVNLDDMLSEVVSRSTCGRAPVTFHRTEVPQRIAADETMLREAVKNLIDNACVHGGERLTRIDIHLTGTARQARITVSDDGDGVDPADFPKILARFGQADPGQGSGLGLSITEAIAERHGGKLILNKVARGFSASLVLPKRRA
ncbi:ATP-binding protein [Breoghania sp. L-A4]|uniref:sensor histidine kinase n=1 Tax=Breoghania sp. L-A4 TaxID=2304600 RepID=UPI000E35A911|nr:ATP-binding protein [Breoghania sp. L-A4]AXS40767.1 ATP-binding protein [Breoghania sp. L-A4]